MYFSGMTFDEWCSLNPDVVAQIPNEFLEVMDGSHIKELQEEIENLQEECVSLESDIADLDRQIIDLESELDDVRQELAALEE